MSNEPHESHGDNPDLVHSGPSHRLAERLGMTHPSLSRRLAKAGLFLLVTWVPLVVLSLAEGHALGDKVKDPLLRDPDVYGRFLFVLPVLELAQTVVAVGLAVHMKHFLEVGVVPEHEHPRFRAAQAHAVRLRSSVVGEGVVAILAISLSLFLRLGLGFSAGTSSWERVGSNITLAGWWYTLVSLPILYFFLFRWVWVYLLWSWFLFRVSRLELELTPTHPDHAGGLGFLAWAQASFATVLMAVSAVCSAGFADEILHRGASLDDLKFHIIVFAVLALLVLQAPLLVFAGKLSRCRFAGLLEFGALVWRHDRAFDEKWIKTPLKDQTDKLLGTSDVQSLADMSVCYEHVNEMRPFPFDTKAFAVLVVAALLPMLPLVGTAVDLKEIFMKLGELLVG